MRACIDCSEAIPEDRCNAGQVSNQNSLSIITIHLIYLSWPTEINRQACMELHSCLETVTFFKIQIATLPVVLKF